MCMKLSTPMYDVEKRMYNIVSTHQGMQAYIVCYSFSCYRHRKCYVKVFISQQINYLLQYGIDADTYIANNLCRSTYQKLLAMSSSRYS